MAEPLHIDVVDAHAGGDVGRVITGGAPTLRGDGLLERLRDLRDNHDWLRRLLIAEPWGALHLCPILPQPSRVADAGILIMESMGYPAVSGSNLMCAATVLGELGRIPLPEPAGAVSLETPAGVIPLWLENEGGRCRAVAYDSVPAFVTHREQPLQVEGAGVLPVSMVYAGVFYAVVDAATAGVELADSARLVETGRRVAEAADREMSPRHPLDPAQAGCAFTLFATPLVPDDDGGLATKSAVYQQPGVICRSPTGTGTAARLALAHARGELGGRTRLASRSPLGTGFEAELLGESRVAGLPAVLARIHGRAFVFAQSRIAVDPEDPMRRRLAV